MPLFLGEKLPQVLLWIFKKAPILLFDGTKLLLRPAQAGAAGQNFGLGSLGKHQRELFNPGLQVFRQHVFDQAELLCRQLAL